MTSLFDGTDNKRVMGIKKESGTDVRATTSVWSYFMQTGGTGASARNPALSL